MSNFSHERRTETVSLPLSSLYYATGFVIGARNEDLYDALCKIGDPPTDRTGRIIPSNTEVYEQVTKWAGYPYARFDRWIYQKYADSFAPLLNDAVVVELGVGGTEGGAKTEAALFGLPYGYKPAGIVLNDQLPENLVLAKEAMIKFRQAKASIQSVAGDMFQEETWGRINKKIGAVNRNRNECEGTLPVVVLLQSPTYNDFSDDETSKLQNFVFSLNAERIYFFPAIDSTIDRTLLNNAYNNIRTRQFALLAVADYCLREKRLFDPLTAESIVEINGTDDGSMKIQHIVTDKHARYVIDPIQKKPEEVVRQDMRRVGTKIVERFPYEGNDFPGSNYAVYVLKRHGLKRPAPGA